MLFRSRIMSLFLLESSLLSLAGAAAGLVLAAAGSVLLKRFIPALPLAVPWWALVSAASMALFTGVIFGILPARRAARLDPVAALSGR